MTQWSKEGMTSLTVHLANVTHAPASLPLFSHRPSDHPNFNIFYLYNCLILLFMYLALPHGI